jgi:hypothetical protein
MVSDHFGLHIREPNQRQIEAAAKQAYLNNRAGKTSWEDLDNNKKDAWRVKVRPIVYAALNA